MKRKTKDNDELGSFTRDIVFWEPRAGKSPIELLKDIIADEEKRRKLVSALTDDKLNALMMACYKKLPECAFFLLDLPDMDINALDYGADTALAWSLTNHLWEVAKGMINKGVKVNTINTTGQSSPLHIAAEEGALEILKLLIEKGADASLKDIEAAASDNGQSLDMVKLLLETKPSLLHEIDNDGYSVIMWAVQSSNYAVLEYLLSLPEAEPLVEKRMKSDQEQTPFLLAAANGVKLLARFADVHATDSGGLNALHVACLNCSIDVAKYLIEELNFEVTVPMNEKELVHTPLAFAVITEDKAHMVKMAEYLLSVPGCNVNHRTSDGASALHIATRLGITAGVKFLLAHGADPTIADNNGNTPSVIAEKHIKKLLVDAEKEHKKKVAVTAVSPKKPPQSPSKPPAKKPATPTKKSDAGGSSYKLQEAAIAREKNKKASVRKRDVPGVGDGDGHVDTDDGKRGSLVRTKSGRISEPARKNVDLGLAPTPTASPRKRPPVDDGPTEKISVVLNDSAIDVPIPVKTAAVSPRRSRDKRVVVVVSPPPPPGPAPPSPITVRVPVSADAPAPVAVRAPVIAPAPAPASTGQTPIRGDKLIETLSKVLHDSGQKILVDIVEPLFAACEKLSNENTELKNSHKKLVDENTGLKNEQSKLLERIEQLERQAQ